MTRLGSGSDCEECGEKGQTFYTSAYEIRSLRFLKIRIRKRLIYGMLCHNCGHFEEGDNDGDS